MVIGTRSYCPVYSFIVVIEIPALQPTVQHTLRCVRNKCLLQLAAASHLCGGLMMVCQKCFDRGHPVNCLICKRPTHSALLEMGFGRAERLHDCSRYSFLLSSAPIHCCDRNACTQPIVQRTRRCDCCFTFLCVMA